MIDRTFREQLETHNNVEEVRQRLASGSYSGRKKTEAEEFVRSKDAAREQAAKDRAEAREDESLRIARKSLKVAEDANDIADTARTWSIVAIVVSMLTALVVAFVQLVYD